MQDRARHRNLESSCNLKKKGGGEEEVYATALTCNRESSPFSYCASKKARSSEQLFRMWFTQCFRKACAQAISSVRSANAISGSIIQNSARCREVNEFSALNVGPVPQESLVRSRLPKPLLLVLLRLQPGALSSSASWFSCQTRRHAKMWLRTEAKMWLRTEAKLWLSLPGTHATNKLSIGPTSQVLTKGLHKNNS